MTRWSLFGDDASVLRERDFQLLLLANGIGPLGPAVITPVLDSLTGPFGVSAADIGLMMSAYTAPAILLIPVVGILADRYGRKPLLVIGLVLFGIGGTAIVLTTDFRVVLGLRLLQGVGTACTHPVIVTSIGDIYRGNREATAQGFRVAGAGGVQSAFPVVSGLVVAVAWQLPFLIYALAFPVAVVVTLWFEEPTALDDPATDDSTAGDPATGDSMADDSAATADGPSATADEVSLLWLARRPPVLAILVANGLTPLVWFGFFTYNSIVVVRLLDGSPAEAGVLATVGSLVFAGTATQVGRITAHFETRHYPLLAGNLCLGGGFAMLLLAPTIAVGAVGVAVSGVGLGILAPMYRSIITGLAPQAVRGGLVSISEAFGRLTATATPILMGLVVTAATPVVGFGPAVQIAGLGIAVIAAGGGVLCVFVAAATWPPR